MIFDRSFRRRLAYDKYIGRYVPINVPIYKCVIACANGIKTMPWYIILLLLLYSCCMHPPEAGGYPLLITAASWKYTKRTCGFRVCPEPGIRATRVPDREPGIRSRPRRYSK